MSVVTNIIITFGLHEEEAEDVFPAIHAVNEWLISQRYGQLARVDHLAGGRKAMESVVFMGAFNHLDIPAFRKVISEAPWIDRECVAMMLLTEQGERFITEYLDEYRFLLKSLAKPITPGYTS